MKEQRKHLDAFTYWFALTEKGHTTSKAVEATAEHCRVHMRSVWTWYDEFGWEQRAIERRGKIQKKMEEQENETLAQNRANYLKILHKILDDYIKKDFPAQIETVKDLETVIKNCLVLQDAPSEVTKTDNVHINVEADSLFDENLMRRITQQEEDLEQGSEEFKYEEFN